MLNIDKKKTIICRIVNTSKEVKKSQQIINQICIMVSLLCYFKRSPYKKIRKCQLVNFLTVTLNINETPRKHGSPLEIVVGKTFPPAEQTHGEIGEHG